MLPANLSGDLAVKCSDGNFGNKVFAPKLSKLLGKKKNQTAISYFSANNSNVSI